MPTLRITDGRRQVASERMMRKSSCTHVIGDVSQPLCAAHVCLVLLSSVTDQRAIDEVQWYNSNALASPVFLKNGGPALAIHGRC
jgi:hypothetical protein